MEPMKILIDTHVFLWWLFDDQRLCARAREIMTNPDNVILISSASAWEIATLVAIFDFRFVGTKQLHFTGFTNLVKSMKDD